MGATYLRCVRETDGRQILDIESDALEGVLVAGPQGFPAPPQERRAQWNAAAWLAWAGPGAEWEYVNEDV